MNFVIDLSLPLLITLLSCMVVGFIVGMIVLVKSIKNTVNDGLSSSRIIGFIVGVLLVLAAVVVGALVVNSLLNR